MKYEDMTQTEKRRFGDYQRCVICNRIIGQDDDIQYTKVRSGRCLHYRFMHYDCLKREMSHAVKGGVYG